MCALAAPNSTRWSRISTLPLRRRATFDCLSKWSSEWLPPLTDRLGPGAANRSLDILKAAFNKAEAWGYRAENSNPYRSIWHNRRVHRKRFLSGEELARLGVLVSERRQSDDPMKRTYASAITLLLLTGCRTGEILGLQWADLRGLRLHLRDSKTAPRTVWLGQEARDVIDGLPRKGANPYMFWNCRFRRPIGTLRIAFRPLPVSRARADHGNGRPG